MNFKSIKESWNNKIYKLKVDGESTNKGFSLEINNSKVFVNNKEVVGLKKWKYLLATYSLVGFIIIPFVIVFSIGLILLTTGIAATFGVLLVGICAILALIFGLISLL